MKIPIKKYVMDESLSWEERYKQLESHHKEETEWLITKVKKLEIEYERAQEKIDDLISEAGDWH